MKYHIFECGDGGEVVESLSGNSSVAYSKNKSVAESDSEPKINFSLMIMNTVNGQLIETGVVKNILEEWVSEDQNSNNIIFTDGKKVYHWKEDKD